MPFRLRLVRTPWPCGRSVTLSLAGAVLWGPVLFGLVVWLAAGPISPAGSVSAAEPVSYSRDIKPLFSDRCYTCHGPDEEFREAELRLDMRDSATEWVIAPGDAKASELVERISSDDPDMRMPPVESHRTPFTAEEIELIRRWIDEGARYEEHWAFVPPVRPTVPAPPSDRPDWARNEIDLFVQARLESLAAEGTVALELSPEADRRTLIRRLTFDLIGLPPTPEEVEDFVGDDDPLAYERLVDRLLANEHYGERMALWWLDLVRYSDTCGIHGDQHRDVWPYRDWVIAAFNENMPFDQFTIEQLAGDLLPEATNAQKIASGYNRLLMTTSEGGAQAKEYEAIYQADRVRNASTVWLGATLGCAQCHDHKFDPYTTRDFYRFGAFFADIQEKAVGAQDQTQLMRPGGEEFLAEAEAEIERLAAALAAESPERTAWQQSWEDSALEALRHWQIVSPQEALGEQGTLYTQLEDGSLVAGEESPEREVTRLTFAGDLQGVTGLRIELLPSSSLPQRGAGRAENGNLVLNELVLTVGEQPVALEDPVASHQQNDWPVAHTIDGNIQSGWAILPETGRRLWAVFRLAPIDTKDAATTGGESENEDETATWSLTLTQDYGTRHTIGRLRISVTDVADPTSIELKDEIATILGQPRDERTEPDRTRLAEYWREIAPELADPRAELAAAYQRRDEVLREKMVSTLISISGPPRTVRVLPRGNWLDDSGPVVEPVVPAFLPQPEIAGERATRLDLAEWLVDSQHPLTARVLTNRLWTLGFGRGLVHTLDDLGSQGAVPTHPELLDWLAVEFVESGWDMKHAMRLIVTSSTYRQSSVANDDQRRLDPQNRWLARQGRFRLPAEIIRDNALAVSGLLVERVGGPSVKPYQPIGYWEHLNFPTRTWEHDHGEAQYRRGLYTYWCRTFLHPSLSAFDAPSREECTVERVRSNTPLQALVLLNDPTFVEAARVLAARVLAEGGDSTRDRLHFVCRQVLQRPPGAEEESLLLDLHAQHLAEYQAEAEQAAELLAVGEFDRPTDADPAETAAWASVCRVLLNLHETITRD